MRTVPALTLDGLASAPWALERATLVELVKFAERGETLTAAARQPSPPRSAGAAAVIPIHGMIEHRSSWMLELLGGSSIEDIRGALRAAVGSPQVSAIVLDIDSPGGGVAGVTELAAEIRAARAQKRVVAMVNTTAASAAYWLAAQADHIMVTPSGQVGSIGIYAVHLDISRALDAQGITPTIISAGERKTDGNEFAPLSDEARAEMQRRADAFYGQFVADVAAGRGVPAATVKADYGNGSVLLARDALKAGMVDAVGTFEDALRLAARPPAAQRAEDGTPDPSEVDLPFRARVEQAAEELVALTEHATVRASLRVKAGRRPFSEPTEAALRSIRDSLSALLPPVESEEPSAPPAPAVESPAPVPVVAAAAAPPRFRSADDWTAWIAKEFGV